MIAGVARFAWSVMRRAVWGVAIAVVDTIEEHVSQSPAAPGHLLEPEPPRHRAKQSARESKLDSLFPGRNGGGD